MSSVRKWPAGQHNKKLDNFFIDYVIPLNLPI